MAVFTRLADVKAGTTKLTGEKGIKRDKGGGEKRERLVLR